MDRSRVNRILDEWNAVANQARRPEVPPRRAVVRSGMPIGTLAGATLVVVALLAAGAWLGRSSPIGIVGGSPSIPPNSTAAPLATPSAAPTPVSAPSTSAAPATAAPTNGSCDLANLSARITLWEGAAGHRIANVELRNTGSTACFVRAMARPQLVDAHTAVLIDGSNPPASGLVAVAPGGVLRTLVQDGNYCGPTPGAPVSVAFVLADGGRIVADPLSPTDATVPPCLGAAGSAGDIQMQPWAP
jgi:hypothetical protein